MKINSDTHRGQLYDANGKEIRYVVEADTETGEVLALETDDAGRFYLVHGGEVAQKRSVHPAPLTFRPEKPCDESPESK